MTLFWPLLIAVQVVADLSLAYQLILGWKVSSEEEIFFRMS
jgi:hypothetical protein